MTPAEYLGAVDGDTLRWRLPVLGEIRLRLADVNCPELSEGGISAKQYVDQVCNNGHDSVQLWIKTGGDTNKDGRVSLLELLRSATSFERLIGTVFIGSFDLRELLFQRGLCDWVGPDAI